MDILDSFFVSMDDQTLFEFAARYVDVYQRYGVRMTPTGNPLMLVENVMGYSYDMLAIDADVKAFCRRTTESRAHC
jgi:hypothetical protein